MAPSGPVVITFGWVSGNGRSNAENRVVGTVRSSSGSSRIRRGGALRTERLGAVRARTVLSGRSQVVTDIGWSPSVGGLRYNGEDSAVGAQTGRRGVSQGR